MGQRVRFASCDGAGVLCRQQPYADADHGASSGDHGGFREFDGAARPGCSHVNVELVEGYAAQDVEADATDQQTGTLLLRPRALNLVDDEPGKWAEVLFVASPPAAGMGGRSEAVRAESFEVAGCVCQWRFSSGSWIGVVAGLQGVDEDDQVVQIPMLRMVRLPKARWTRC